MLTHFKSAYQYSVANCKKKYFLFFTGFEPTTVPQSDVWFWRKNWPKDLFLQLLARSFSLRECRRKLTARCLAMKLLKIIMMRKKKKKRPNERSNTEQRTVRKIYRNKFRVAADAKARQFCRRSINIIDLEYCTYSSTQRGISEWILTSVRPDGHGYLVWIRCHLVPHLWAATSTTNRTLECKVAWSSSKQAKLFE